MNTRISVGIIAIAILCVVAVLGYRMGIRVAPELSREGGGATSNRGNPYKYDISGFRKTDPALIGYTGVKQLKAGVAQPTGIAVDKADNIYVAGENELVVMDGNGIETGRMKLEGQANCVAIDRNGDILIGMSDHIEVRDGNGTKTATWTGLGEHACLTSIAIVGDNVFVADAGARLVWRYDKTGRLLGEIGKKDAEHGVLGFIVPSPYFDVAAGTDDTLWAVSPGRLRLENYSADGKIKSFWGVSSMAIEGFCGCCNPSHIAIKSDGSFVTSEKGLPRVKVYDLDGKFRCVVAGPEQFDESAAGLDVAVDSDGRILVLDPGRGVVRIFRENGRAGNEAGE